ncbi:hypothetical protein AAG906_012870 [Vitis piasezkii]
MGNTMLLISTTITLPFGAYFWNLNEATNTTVLMNCEQPISDGNYIPITPCNGSNVTSSSSQAYVYALVGGESMGVGDIKYSCTILRTIATRFLKPGNLSMSDLQEMLLLGVDLSFLRFRCKSKCVLKWPSCDPDFAKNTVKCGHWFVYWLTEFYPRTFSIKGLREYYYYYNYGSAVLVGWLMRSILLIIIIGRTALGILCLLVYLIYKFQRRHLSLDDDIEEFLHSHNNLQPIKYSYSEVKKMTHNFKNKLGQGGFGSVQRKTQVSTRVKYTFHHGFMIDMIEERTWKWAMPLRMKRRDVELLQMPPKPTLYSMEMPVEDHRSNPFRLPISTCHSMGTITLDGR